MQSLYVFNGSIDDLNPVEVSGADVNVYINTGDRFVLLDNVSAVQIQVQSGVHEVYDISSLLRKFVQPSGSAVTGFLQMNQVQLNTMEHLGLEQIDGVYYQPELRIAVFRYVVTPSELKKAALSELVLEDVYFSTPGFTLIADQQAVQLVHQFVALRRKLT